MNWNAFEEMESEPAKIEHGEECRAYFVLGSETVACKKQHEPSDDEHEAMVLTAWGTTLVKMTWRS